MVRIVSTLHRPLTMIFLIGFIYMSGCKEVNEKPSGFEGL